MYPYLPDGRTIEYVPADNPFMQAAKFSAEKFSLDPMHETGAVLVVEGKYVIGRGANGSLWHTMHDCVRKKQKISTGEGYELCEGCHPKNHAEQKAISDALDRGNSTEGADLYLWGHWWCCQSCWEVMIDAGIKNVYLPEGATETFKA